MKKKIKKKEEAKCERRIMQTVKGSHWWVVPAVFFYGDCGVWFREAPA